MWPALLALKALGGSGSNEELLAKVIEIGGYPESVQTFIHTDNRQTKLSYNLAWARTYLKRVGAIENSTRGIWSITEIGEQLSQQDMEAIPTQVRRQDYDRRQIRLPTTDFATDIATKNGTSPPDDQWRDLLLSTVREISADQFERLAQRLLREAGFIKVEVTGRSGDGGIDGLGVLRVNLLSFHVLFQCKRYQGTVGAGAVRDFRGAMVGRSDKGLMITTGTFSLDAKREATRDGAPAIDLIDGEQLCDLLKHYKLGIFLETVERISIDQPWFSRL